jgi:signal transduction histidine kinase
VAGWTGREIPEAYQPITGTLRERLRTATRDPGTHADLLWMVAYYGYGWLPCLMLPLWPVGLVVDGVWSGLLGRQAVVLPLIGRLADLDADWSQSLLKPSPKARLAVRVEELTQTRAGAVAAHGAELRRIERDLHDGTQARLVSLSMRIGLAKREYDRDPEAARKLLEDAQDQAEEALAELRHVVRGIHPPILTDRGLAGAVRALAASSGLDVTVTVDGLEDGAGEGGPRAPAAVEAAAYFVVAEALTNAAKHSGSERAEVRLARARTGLRVRVRDEGRGGADESGGSGLLGMRRRVAALDGTVGVTSPVGGPTVIEVELPCVW